MEDKGAKEITAEDVKNMLEKAEEGNEWAMFMVGLRKFRDSGGNDGLGWLERSAALGCAPSIVLLALYWGEMGDDREKAFSWWMRGAEEGDPFCMSMVGACYRDGVGVPRDEWKARLWMARSAVAEATKDKKKADSTA